MELSFSEFWQCIVISPLCRSERPDNDVYYLGFKHRQCQPRKIPMASLATITTDRYTFGTGRLCAIVCPPRGNHVVIDKERWAPAFGARSAAAAVWRAELL